MSRPEIYGFVMGGTSRLLYLLKNINCCYLVFPNNLDVYLDMLLHDQPEYILGLGSYSGVDQDKIRIETLCSNQFRNDFVDSNIYTETSINPFLTLSHPGLKYANAIGNSYCNQVSWQIVKLINEKKLKSRYTFLHIPKSIYPYSASPVIDDALAAFKDHP